MADSGSIAHGNVSIGASAALLVAARAARESVLIYNNHASQILYIGNSTSVTTSNGLPLIAGASVRLYTSAAVYAIASGASTDARYLEEH